MFINFRTVWLNINMAVYKQSNNFSLKPVKSVCTWEEISRVHDHMFQCQMSMKCIFIVVWPYSICHIHFSINDILYFVTLYL